MISEGSSNIYEPHSFICDVSLPPCGFLCCISFGKISKTEAHDSFIFLNSQINVQLQELAKPGVKNTPPPPADWMCALCSTKAWLSVFMSVCHFIRAHLCVLFLLSHMRGCGTNPCNLSYWHPPPGWELVTPPDADETWDPPFLFIPALLCERKLNNKSIDNFAEKTFVWFLAASLRSVETPLWYL